MIKRTINFSTAEVDMLLQLVEEKKAVIENKRTDRVNTAEKEKTWKSIETDFNATFSTAFRSYKVLKTKYENIKKTAKKNIALNRKETYLTGGGSKAVTVSATDEKIMGICQERQLLGDEAIFDDDTPLQPEDNLLEADSFNERVDETQQQNNFAENDTDKSWEHWKPQMLKRPLQTELQTKKRKRDVWAEVGAQKLNLLTLQIEHEKENQKENRENQKLMREKTELEIKKLQLEILIKEKELQQ